jgi:hypothetical protein
MLRHIVATISYRGGKALRGAPAEFSNYRASATGRTPVEILKHLGDLFDWSLKLADGKHEWHDSETQQWDVEVARFFAGLEALDKRLASDTPLGCSEEKLFQGPLADALTHIGQIAMLRRMSGAPMRGENYFRAEIVAGRIGAEQAKPGFEFD